MRWYALTPPRNWGYEDEIWFAIHGFRLHLFARGDYDTTEKYLSYGIIAQKSIYWMAWPWAIPPLLIKLCKWTIWKTQRNVAG
jgi:hypothetical protein